MCFTNLSHDHLDYHGSLDAYFEAKARLFTPRFTRHAAVNVDDPYGARARATRARRDGLDVCDLRGRRRGGRRQRRRDVELHAPTAPRFDARRRARRPRRRRVDDRCVGASTSRTRSRPPRPRALAGFALDAVVRRAAAADPSCPAGSSGSTRGQRFTVLVDYAHTPDALEHVLAAAACSSPAERPGVVVFGCGGDRDRAKRPLMGAVAAALAPTSRIVTTDNPRSEDPQRSSADVLAGVRAPIVDAVVELDRRARDPRARSPTRGRATSS